MQDIKYHLNLLLCIGNKSQNNKISHCAFSISERVNG